MSKVEQPVENGTEQKEPMAPLLTKVPPEGAPLPTSKVLNENLTDEGGQDRVNKVVEDEKIKSDHEEKLVEEKETIDVKIDWEKIQTGFEEMVNSAQKTIGKMKRRKIRREYAQWHGSIGAEMGFPQPILLADSNDIARPGYGRKQLSREYGEVSRDVLRAKIKILAEMIRRSKSFTAYTGAGLSTNSGIPDYATKSSSTVTKVGKVKTNMILAQPTLSHKILTAMHRDGFLKNWVQQNHDGLPQKAGFPQRAINEIHGAWFNPGNPVIKMRGKLRDDLADAMQDIANRSDLTLVLGSSLSGMLADRVFSGASLRFIWGENSLGGVIVNFQNTQRDEYTSLRIYSDIDTVMVMLAEELGVKNYENLKWNLDEKKIRRKKNFMGRVVEDVFLIPYNPWGLHDPNWEMEFDLRRRAKLVLLKGRDKGCSGKVLGRNEEGHYRLNFIKEGVTIPGNKVKDQSGKGQEEKSSDSKGEDMEIPKPGKDCRPGRCTLGSWWIEDFTEGVVPKLPLMNYPNFCRKIEESETLSPSVIKKVEDSIAKSK